MKILGLLLLAVLVRSEPPVRCGDDVCHRYASCVGGNCECNLGYTGDGKSCIGTKICGRSDDCDVDATCTNTGPGMYECTCNEGFVGDGKSCEEKGLPPGQCQKMDIIFVLDRSSSIRTIDYDLMRKFLLSLGEKLKIGQTNSKGEVLGQGAIVTFSEQGSKRITLQQSRTPGRFANVVQSMPGPLPGGRTKTHRGLALADREVVIKSAGYREDDSDVEKIFMVITDGRQTRESPRRGYKYVGEAMKPFFQRDMNVFAVGVGLTDSSAIQQIKDMVQEPQNAILAKDFKELSETVNSFIQKFCPVPSPCGVSDDCAEQATCTELGGGEYSCTCLDGYVGNGKFCVVPPVCGTERDDCHPFYATCADTIPGEYQCRCVPGYVGDGKTCVVDKVCGTPKDDCHLHATCTDLGAGKYECNCNIGYSGDGKTCIAIGIAFESLTYDVRENDKKAIVQISVESGEITTPLTFNFNTVLGTAGEEDITAVSRSITLQPGQSGPLLVEIDIMDDTQVEPTESFQVTLSDPSYPVQIGQPATVNILDNDEAVIAFTKQIVDVREDQTAVMEIGFVSGSSSSPVTLSLSTNARTASDDDFIGKTVDVTFEAGETGPKTVEFEIVDDKMVENTESFFVSMVSSSLSAVKLGEASTVNILDNDEAVIGFTEDVYETTEDAGKARVGVDFLSGESVIPVTVGFTTSAGTAASGDDFVSKSVDVTFKPGEKGPKWIEIDITDDALLEPTESFGVLLVSSSVEAVKLGKPSSVNIQDNDDAVIGFVSQSYKFPEDEKAKIEIGYLSGVATSPVTVRLAMSPDTADNKDFVAKEVEVTFQPGETGPKVVEIDLEDDLLVEETEAFTVSLISSTNPAVQLGNPAKVGILDNDAAMISFTSSVYDVNEDGKAIVEIEFASGQAAVPVTVQLATSPATATEDDFVSKTVDVTFQPGEKGPKRVEFEIFDDKLVESTESFNVSLVSSSVPAVISGEPAIVNIRDNDEAVIEFTQSVYETPENKNAVIEFAIASGQIAIPVTVSLSTAPNTADSEDFVSKTMDVTFLPGETGPKQVVIEVNDDSFVEPTENFKISMKSSVAAVKAEGTSQVNILDNDEAIISFVDLTSDVKEDEDAVIDIAVSSGKIAQPVTVTVATEPLTAGNKDFVPKTVNLTFIPGQVYSKRLIIDIIDDVLVEPTEEFKVKLVASSVPSVKLGEPVSVNIHLQDNDDAVIGFSKTAYDVIESENAKIELGFASGTTSTPVTVTLQTVPSTALENDDFVPKTVNVTFQAGERGIKTVEIDIVDDLLVESTEEFKVAVVSSSVPAVKWGEPVPVNILDNDEVRIQFKKKSYDVKENEDAVIDIEFTKGSVTSPVTIQLTAKQGTAKHGDFITKTEEVTFQPGEKGPKSVTFDIVDDDLVESQEDFYVSFESSTSSAVKFGDPTVINIRDNDEAVIGFSKSVYVVTEDRDAVVDVAVISGKIDIPVTVRMSAAPSTAGSQDFVPKQFDLEFAPGETGPKFVEIDVLDDNLLEDKEAFAVSLLSSSVPAVKLGQPSSVEILDNDEVVVAFTKTSYDANEDKKATVQVELASGKSDIPITVWLRTSPETADSSDYSDKPVEIMFQPGETGPKSIDIDLVDDQILEDTEQFTVHLTPSTPGVKAGKPAAVLIFDNEVAPICGTPQDDCHRYAACADTAPGKYSCKCNKGYTGDGKTCVAINICGTDQDDCHGDATCIDTGPGTYLCSCNEGFTGDGKDCIKRPDIEPQCQKMDLILVLDRSASIRRDDYEHMRDFLLQLGKSLKIGEKDENGDVIGQGAIVTFSEQGTVRITLKQSQKLGRFAEVVRTMPGPLDGGRTKTHKGLDVADKQVVIPEAGLRMNDPNVAKIFMVITDGQQTVESRRRGFKYVGEAMKTFHDRGYLNVFAVGVGLDSEKAINEVKDMVEEPQNAILTKNYEELSETVQSFILKFCPVPSVCGSKYDDCDKNLATCVDKDPGSYECTCNLGYVGNGKTCLAPYVCGTPRDDCHPYLASCTDSGMGKYDCQCVQHYVGDGKTCTATQICGTVRDECHELASCTDTGPGSYKCRCKKGYVGGGKICKVEKICGSYKDDCHKFATCQDNGPGEYQCTCSPGYTGDGKSCEEVKICGTPKEDCSKFATCTNTGPETYTCTCNEGYIGDGKTCQARKICGTPQEDCSEFATCTDTGPGTYTCTCKKGYTGNGKKCKAIKICGTPQEDCSEFATCIDTGPGTYTCTCNKGYTGDGKTCKEINICGTDEDDCHKYAVCKNIGPGQHSCKCIQGYTGDGRSCKGPEIYGPVLFEVIPENPSTISAAWRVPPEIIELDIIDFLVCYRDMNNGDERCTTKQLTTPESPLQIEFTDVNEDTTYEVVVTARNASGYGPPSNVMNVKTPKINVEPCDKKTDTIFVVDRSSSISAADYNKIRSFIQSVAKRLRIGVKNDQKKIIGQGAIVTFSNEGQKIINLKDSKTPGRFSKAVKSMPGPLADGETKTHRGLEVAYREVAQVITGLRARDNSVHKVVVLITNSHQTREKNGYVYVGDAVKPFFNRGIDVIAIGVGLETEKAKEQLYDMVRLPANLFLVKHHSDLSSAMKKILPRVCPATKICGTLQDDCHRFATCFDTGPGQYKCACREGYSGDGKECAEKKCKFDIGFLIDSSASMRDCNYDKEKNLVKHIAEQLQVAPNKSHASVILFSKSAATYKKFNKFGELREFNMLVEELPMVGGGTHLDKALEKATSEMFTTANGMRDSTVPKLLFVLTDGAQAVGSLNKPLQDIVTSLHKKNIRVIAIGAGEADEKQLSQLVQSSSDLLMVKRFKDATDQLTIFADNMCSVGRCSYMKMVVPVRIERCTSPQPVKIGKCMGKCVTGPNFRAADGIFKMDCQTCKPAGYKVKTVILNCPEGRKRSVEIREETSCVCEKCPWKKLL